MISLYYSITLRDYCIAITFLYIASVEICQRQVPRIATEKGLTRSPICDGCGRGDRIQPIYPIYPLGAPEPPNFGDHFWKRFIWKFPKTGFSVWGPSARVPNELILCIATQP